MNDKDKITEVLQEMSSGAGASPAMRTVADLVSQWMNIYSDKITARAKDLAEKITEISEDTAERSAEWTKDDGRFDSKKWARLFQLKENNEASLDLEENTIAEFIGATLAKVDAAYGDNFLVGAARIYLRNVATYARLFQQEVTE